MPQHTMKYEVLFYIPNIIDYVRIFFLFVAIYFREQTVVCLSLYTVSNLLDAIDGPVARKLNQVSEFGAWLDVVIDNISRAFLWSMASEIGFLVSALEWVTLTCNHNMGSSWKQDIWKESLSHAPWFVPKVMANGFQTPWGVAAIGSLHCLPVWLFLQKRAVLRLPPIIELPVTIALCCLRILCGAVEIWCISVHVKTMLVQKKVDGVKDSSK